MKLFSHLCEPANRGILCSTFEIKTSIGETGHTRYMKQGIQKALHHLGHKIHRVRSSPQEGWEKKEGGSWISEAPPKSPIWPLPRCQGGLSNDHIREEFAKYDLWHYAYVFEGGLSFLARHNDPGPLADAPERPLQRFRHFMPYLIAANNGSLEGKRVLLVVA